MSAPDLSPDVMTHFRESGAEKHTTILLGAGASITSGLPGWDELVTGLLVGSGAVPDAETASLLLRRQDPLLVAEAARAQFKDAWLEKVRNELYKVSAPPESSPLHRAAVAHALTGVAEDTSLVTLNFDTLLEEALMKELSDGAYRATPPAVVHLHGVISLIEIKDVIFTLTDFLDVLIDPASWQREYLHAAFSKGALVIAGTSYRDPDVRQWFHTAKKEAPHGHAALVILAREGFQLDRPHFESLRDALREQWSAVGLRAVLVDDHSDAAQAIRELRHVNRADYLSPSERARMMWEMHRARFDELQVEYAEQLIEDAESLRSVFGVERLSLSLWLSDGAGSLVRWAADDRLYRDADALRVVETGHDSPWVAGRALSTETLLIQNIERAGTRRWGSVAAVSIPIDHPTHPQMAAAVITVGLPSEAHDYEESSFLWAARLSQIGDSWSTRLSETAFGTAGLPSRKGE